MQDLEEAALLVHDMNDLVDKLVRAMLLIAAGMAAGFALGCYVSTPAQACLSYQQYGTLVLVDASDSVADKIVWEVEEGVGLWTLEVTPRILAVSVDKPGTHKVGVSAYLESPSSRAETEFSVKQITDGTTENELRGRY